VSHAQFLINDLKSSKSLSNGRYTIQECVNFNDTGKNVKKGNFSIIFKGYDIIEGRPVFIKFFDPQFNTNPYRLECYKREVKLLTKLINKKGCLQIYQAITDHEISIKQGEFEIPILFQYYVAEWLDYSYEEYFERDTYDALAKLKAYNEIIKAVETLHRNLIYHRDIKPNNIRARSGDGSNAVLIDLGTSIEFSSSPIMPLYDEGPGQIMYAPIEARLGLSSIRHLGKYTDLYSLGCMLFELFSNEYFFLTIKNDFLRVLYSMKSELSAATDQLDRLAIYHEKIYKYENIIKGPILPEQIGSAPESINDLIADLITRLTETNYINRDISLVQLRSRIWTCIRILEHERMAKIRVRRKKVIRQKREEKLLKRIGKITKEGKTLNDR
jgi:serine/threonine protein kinase